MTSTRLAVTLPFSIFLCRLSVLIMTELRLRALKTLAIETRWKQNSNNLSTDESIDHRAGFHVYMRFDDMDHQHFFHCILFVCRRIANGYAINWCRQKLHVLCISYVAWFCISHCVPEPRCRKTKHPFSFYAHILFPPSLFFEPTSIAKLQPNRICVGDIAHRRYRACSCVTDFPKLFLGCFNSLWRIILIRQKLIHLFWTVPLPHRR